MRGAGDISSLAEAQEAHTLADLAEMVGDHKLRIIRLLNVDRAKDLDESVGGVVGPAAQELVQLLLL